MRQIWIIFLLLSACLTSGCSVIQSGKLLAPESFGLIPIAPNIYVEKGMDNAIQVKLREGTGKAEEALHAAYGSVNSRPNIHACATEKCYESFGGRGEKAKVFGNRILLSPRGLNWHLTAHEWSHSEMSTRLSPFAWKRMPQWFDEGVAVVISEAPEHSESHWQYLVAKNIGRPTSEELHTLRSLKEWINAYDHYDKNKIERMVKGEPEISPVYAAAGHELRPWLAKVGSQGLLAFIARMNEGADFEAAYPTANTPIPKDATQAKHPAL